MKRERETEREQEQKQTELGLNYSVNKSSLGKIVHSHRNIHHVLNQLVVGLRVVSLQEARRQPRTKYLGKEISHHK